MIDMLTQKPITVDTDGQERGGFLDIPLDQLDPIVALLKANAIPHWVAEEALSMDDGPFEITITLSQRADPVVVQRLLDSVP